MARPHSSQIVHEVKIRNQHGVMQPMPTLIDCSATHILMSPPLFKRHGVPHKAVYITTHYLPAQVIAHGTKSHKTAMADQ
jgi:hypothetical protein